VRFPLRRGIVGKDLRLAGASAPQPPPSAAVYRCSGGLRRRGALFVARRAIPLHVLSLASHRSPGIRSGRGRAPTRPSLLASAEGLRIGATEGRPPKPWRRGARGSMRRFRRGARPRRTRCGTAREGNKAGADVAALECRDLREWILGGRSPSCGCYADNRGPEAPASLLRPPSATAAPCTVDPRRSGGFHEAAGTFLVHLRNAGEECPHQAVPIASSGMAASGHQPEFPTRLLLRRRIQACLLRCARSDSST
jgi:hypothetical protein